MSSLLVDRAWDRELFEAARSSRSSELTPEVEGIRAAGPGPGRADDQDVSTAGQPSPRCSAASRR